VLNAEPGRPDGAAGCRFPGPRPVNAYVPFPRAALGQSIPERFAGQVARGVDRLAVKHGARSLTYGALDGFANRVAGAVLDALGSTPEPVALLLEQGPALVAAILGVLKAGKIYVPLDPSFPPAHLATQIVDSGARLLLTSSRSRMVGEVLVGELSPRPVRALDVEAIDTAAAGDDPRPVIPPEAGAYIFYTSGSTGRPKGVLDTHTNVLHNVMRYTNTLRIGSDDRLTLLQGPSFSGAVSSLFGALLNGAAVFPFDVPGEGMDRIAPWLEREGITIYHSVPALFRRVAESGRSFPVLRLVRLEGDQASPRDVELFKRYLSPGAILVNGLGATECGIVRQFFVDHDTAVPDGVLPIGYPVEDMDVVLLDETGRDVAAGEVGEIAVRSRYLAREYWGQPELTAAAFRASPGQDGPRTYRTGDLGRFRPDGCLEHLGRKDFQLKIDGNRVEAAEVEAALLEAPDIREAAVATREDSAREPRLVAYIVPSAAPGPTVTSIRRRLARRLPAYKIPTAYVMLDALPLNANAKVDRRALPAPSAARPHLETTWIGPQNLLQQQLIQIWERVLGVSPIGSQDDFFELGGSSLLAVRMADEVERVLGRRPSLPAMLESSTIEHLADTIQGEAAGLAESVVRVHEDGRRPPFFFLHGDYLSGGFYCRELARRLGPDQPLYVLPAYGLDGGAIPDSYQAMAERHLEAVRALLPRGPYRLGGVCNGGLVALEMGRRLLAERERVEHLILVGASAMNARWRLTAGPIGALGWWMRRGPADRFDEFLTRVHSWDSLPVSGRARLLLGMATRFARRLLPRPRRPALGDTPPSPRVAPGRASRVSELRARTRQAYRRLDRDYTPGPYLGRVVVLWPGEDLERFQAARWWKAVARDVHFQVVPGDHTTSLTRHVDALAAAIGHHLTGDTAGDARG
jgi:amino acid adenylation domain-containing protein